MSQLKSQFQISQSLNGILPLFWFLRIVGPFAVRGAMNLLFVPENSENKMHSPPFQKALSPKWRFLAKSS